MKEVAQDVIGITLSEYEPAVFASRILECHYALWHHYIINTGGHMQMLPLGLPAPRQPVCSTSLRAPRGSALEWERLIET